MLGDLIRRDRSRPVRCHLAWLLVVSGAIACSFEPSEAGGSGAASLGPATSGSASATASDSLSGTRPSSSDTSDNDTGDEDDDEPTSNGSGSSTTAEPAGPFGFRRRLGLIESLSVDVRDLVVLVSLDDSRMTFDHAEPDGTDIAFVSADGSSRFAHEIESYDAQAGTATIWVHVPLLGPSHDHMWMYYGSSEVIPPVESGLVWGTGYHGVFHMGDLLDSSDQGNHAIGSGLLATDGEMGGAQDFSASGVAELPTAGLSLAEGAASFWFRRTTEGLSGNEFLFYASGTENITGFSPAELHVHLGNSGAGIVLNMHTGAGASVIGDRAFVDGSWHHAFASWRAGGQARLLVDGEHLFARNQSGAMPPIDSVVQLGRSGASGSQFAGSIDELRIFRTIPEDTWIELDHRTQADRLLTYSIEEEL